MIRIVVLSFLPLFIALSQWGFADESKPTPIVKLAGSDPVVSSSPLTVLFGLLFVLAVIFALAWLVKQYNNSGLIGNRTMKIVASLPLGTRERAVLIEVGDKQILVGVAPNSVNALHVFDEKIIDSDGVTKHPFANKLNQLLASQAKNASQNQPSKSKPDESDV